MKRIIRLKPILPLVVVAFFQVNAGHASQWERVMEVHDWGDRDRDWSVGYDPDPHKCTPAWENSVAVCWSQRGSPRGQVEDWCTYKTVTINTPENGSNKGVTWVCK